MIIRNPENWIWVEAVAFWEGLLAAGGSEESGQTAALRGVASTKKGQGCSAIPGLPISIAIRGGFPKLQSTHE